MAFLSSLFTKGMCLLLIFLLGAQPCLFAHPWEETGLSQKSPTSPSASSFPEEKKEDQESTSFMGKIYKGKEWLDKKCPSWKWWAVGGVCLTAGALTWYFFPRSSHQAPPLITPTPPQEEDLSSGDPIPSSSFFKGEPFNLLNNLPPELQGMIMGELPPRDLSNFRLTSKEGSSIIQMRTKRIICKNITRHISPFWKNVFTIHNPRELLLFDGRVDLNKLKSLPNSIEILDLKGIPLSTETLIDITHLHNLGRVDN
jgi:hypothetical protein